MRKKSEMKHASAETREELDLLWQNLHDSAVGDDALLEVANKHLNNEQDTCSLGLTARDMLCIVPGRVNLLKQTNYKISALISDDEIKKMLVGYHHDHLQYLLDTVCDIYSQVKSVNIQSIARVISSMFHYDGVSQTLNMIGSERIKVIFAVVASAIDIHHLIEREKIELKRSKPLHERWNEILVGCSLDVLKALNHVLSNEEHGWINHQSIQNLITENISERTEQQNLPRWLNALHYQEGFWLYYRSNVFAQSSYSDSIEQRVKKIEFISQIFSERQKRHIKDSNVLLLALRHDQLAIARSLITHFGTALVTTQVFNYTLLSGSFDALAALFMQGDACDAAKLLTTLLTPETEVVRERDFHDVSDDEEEDAPKAALIDVLTHRIVRNKPMPEELITQSYRKNLERRYITAVTEFDAAIARSRIEMLEVQFLTDTANYASILQQLFRDIVAHRIHCKFSEVVTSLHLPQFNEILSKLERNTESAEVKLLQEKIHTLSWCTIYHYNAIFAHLKSQYGERKDWRYILARAKIYATTFFKNEVRSVEADHTRVSEIAGESGNFIILARQRKIVNWMRQQALYQEGKTTQLSRALSMPCQFEKSVRSKATELQSVSSVDSLYLLVDAKLQASEPLKKSKSMTACSDE